MNMYVTPDQNTVVIWQDEAPKNLTFCHDGTCAACALHPHIDPQTGECAGCRRPTCCGSLGRSDGDVGNWEVR